MFLSNSRIMQLLNSLSPLVARYAAIPDNSKKILDTFHKDLGAVQLTIHMTASRSSRVTWIITAWALAGSSRQL